MPDPLARELIENLEEANADPEGADQKDWERTRKVEPLESEEEDGSEG